MWKVSEFIEEELEDYEEYKQDFMIFIYENDIEVANTWIENFKEELSQYMDREIKKIEYGTESADVYII